MKLIKKLIFIISVLMVVALNLFGEIKERIEFYYYYYTNKLYHSTLKTEIIPSEYVFIMTNSTNKNEYLYLYNLKTKEKKLFYVDRSYYDDKEYYDINGNLTTNWTDENMEANGLYEITNNRFGETFYNLKRKIKTDYDKILISKENGYIQKAYKYSLTQPEIINKKDRGIYLFKKQGSQYILCFQNEYYKEMYNEGYFRESGLLNYNSNGNIELSNKIVLSYSIQSYDYLLFKSWLPPTTSKYGVGTDIINIFDLNKKTLSITPNITTYNKFMNDTITLINKDYGAKDLKYLYTEDNVEDNLNKYKK